MNGPIPSPSPSIARGAGKYGHAALASELATLAGATEGTRNDTLNRAAFSLGSLVAGGDLDRHRVETALLAIALSVGLSESEARATIKSGMEAGAQEPRMASKGDGHDTTVISVTGVPKEVHTEPVPLPDELSAVANFDFALLPESVRSWAEDISERIQCPPDFVAVGIMTSLAAVIGRKVGVRPQARTDWTVIPNLWALAVGRPGVLKSPAMEATLAPLKRLIAKANEQHKAAFEDYKLNLTVARCEPRSRKSRPANSLRKTRT